MPSPVARTIFVNSSFVDLALNALDSNWNYGFSTESNLERTSSSSVMSHTRFLCFYDLTYKYTEYNLRQQGQPIKYFLSIVDILSYLLSISV